MFNMNMEICASFLFPFSKPSFSIWWKLYFPDWASITKGEGVKFRSTPKLYSFQKGSGQAGSPQKCRDSPNAAAFQNEFKGCRILASYGDFTIIWPKPFMFRHTLPEGWNSKVLRVCWNNSWWNYSQIPKQIMPHGLAPGGAPDSV